MHQVSITCRGEAVAYERERRVFTIPLKARNLPYDIVAGLLEAERGRRRGRRRDRAVSLRWQPSSGRLQGHAARGVSD